ncbi:putative Thiamine biosynthesis protein ThiS [Nitrospira sp. KM1]|uniref:sulfur carrier protein ThiS n=1 Tax=Nitrospira sp. KM1 TaxID=1936990 RepID=UPI0013A71979|nr:sulfur carrier protein ThiS [Nitrospira sp. KM1]BCA53003.1 putative Thiamine biosynthesis protein ThiS [Nitrospira sp. KM1]
MVVTVNGKPEETRASVLLDLLKEKTIEPQMVAVELNDAMIDRASLDSTPLRDGDRIEFLFYMGGGR